MGVAGITTTREPAARTSQYPSLWRRTPYRVEDWFDEATIAEMRAYTRPLKRLRIVRKVLGWIVTVAVIVGHVGPRVLDAVGVRGWALQVVVVMATLLLIDLLYEPWFAAWVQLRYDKRHGLSNQTVKGFVKDQVTEFVIGLVVSSVLLIAVYALIRATDLWWLYGGLVFTGFQAFFMLIGPTVILPRFNKFTPLEDGELRTKIEKVADRAGEEIQGIYVMDASKRSVRDNAAVAGWGPTKRVLIFDTMLEHPHHVLEQVVAHEIGHYRLRHLPKSLIATFITQTATFAFLGWFTSWDWILERADVSTISNPAAIPVLLLGFGIASTVTKYTDAWFSRYHERQADLEALELLGDPEAFIDVWRKMTPKNKADLEPSIFDRGVHDHPETPERMAFGQRWAELNPDVTPVAN